MPSREHASVDFCSDSAVESPGWGPTEDPSSMSWAVIQHRTECPLPKKGTNFMGTQQGEGRAPHGATTTAPHLCAMFPLPPPPSSRNFSHQPPTSKSSLSFKSPDTSPSSPLPIPVCVSMLWPPSQAVSPTTAGWVRGRMEGVSSPARPSCLPTQHCSKGAL
uniref:Uncharacterized protein n=1 Tax=Molossus molossus TaxID=27622 RepID=A0A7J8HGX2_MOLMO|nr:hypothetical protein HJG59_010934 [Molossus molossus]